MGSCGRHVRSPGQCPDNVPSPPARVQQARADYHAVMQPLAVERYKFIDESGIHLAMTRLFGRAPRGNASLIRSRRTMGPT